jgi:kinetochore protein Spc24
MLIVITELSRTHQTLNNAHIENISTHSSTAHASEIATLDTQKFRIAKTANDFEIESERLSSQLLDLQSRVQELEMQGLEGDMNNMAVGKGGRGRSMVDDEITLKLKVYRSLGFEIADEDEGGRGHAGAGDYKKVLVKNEKGGMHVVKLEDKFSRHFVAGYLWKMVA